MASKIPERLSLYNIDFHSHALLPSYTSLFATSSSIYFCSRLKCFFLPSLLHLSFRTEIKHSLLKHLTKACFTISPKNMPGYFFSEHFATSIILITQSYTCPSPYRSILLNMVAINHIWLLST